MANAAYADILNARREDIKEPQPLPLGTYTAIVKEMPRVDKGGKNNNDFVEILFSLIAAGPDVSPDELAAAGGLPKEHKHTFWLTERSLFIIDRFLEAAGLSKEEFPQLSDAIFATPGRSVTVTIVLGKKSQKTGKQYPEISEFAPA